MTPERTERLEQALAAYMHDHPAPGGREEAITIILERFLTDAGYIPGEHRPGIRPDALDASNDD